MKCRIVNSRDVLFVNRFDGSYHNADVNVYDSIIKSHSDHNLDYYCSTIFTSGRAKRMYTKQEFGYPFLSNADVASQNPLSACNYASKKYSYDETAFLKGGMILTGRVGAIGQTSFVPKFWEQYGMMGSDNIIRIVVKPEYKNGFIYAYLASKVGNLSFWKHATGGVQPFITDKMVGNLPIPNFPESFQKEVDDLIQQSATLREQATAKLDEAKKIFENEIGVSNTDYGAYKNEGIAIQSIAGKFKRMDSQYQIGHKSIVKEKRNLTTTKINDVAKDIFTGNRGKRNYVENDGIYFLSSSEMMLANPKRFCKKISRRTPNLNDLLVKKGNILISRSGTVGNTILVSDDLNGCAVSEHAMRLVIDEEKIAPEYVFAYFCTKQGKDSLAILPYGSVIVTLGEEFLGDVDLPLLPIETQDRITALVKEYSKMTDMAIEKENKAITMVEEEIEKWQSPTA